MATSLGTCSLGVFDLPQHGGLNDVVVEFMFGCCIHQRLQGREGTAHTMHVQLEEGRNG